MAPREATGSFPDQFLLFDYDSVVAPAVPPPPQPPQPPVPPPHSNNNNNNHTAAAAADPNNGGAENTGVVPGVDISGNSNSAAAATDDRGAGAISPVDPLSIDPTNHHPNRNSEVPSHWSPPHTGENTWRHHNNSVTGSPFPTQTVSFSPNNTDAHVVSSNTVDPSSSPLSTGSSVFQHHQGHQHPHQSSSPPPANHEQASAWTEVTPTTTTTTASTAQRHFDMMGHHESGQFELENVPGMQAAHVIEADYSSQYAQQHPPQQQQISCLPSSASDDSSDSMRMIYRNVAFDGEEGSPSLVAQTPVPATATASHHHNNQQLERQASFSSAAGASPRAIMLSFGPNTTVDDLKYFAERGCIVALLEALKTPRLVTLGTRMLADYAKMAHRRVAVASNKRILDFVQRTMLHVSDSSSNWIGREYAVETVRSLTATEASDQYLMSTPGLLKTLALISVGGPFVTTHNNDAAPSQEGGTATPVPCTVPLASEKAQLHACIAIMNLSCGKANKMEIAQVTSVLEAMRDVMMGSNEEACLKATTCIKNLSNADANDAALLGTPGLVQALGHVAATTCSSASGATVSTTNACLALMNLSISKANKHNVFRTPGVMEALMKVLDRTKSSSSSAEARVKACSALSNLAIGYDNKIPMFHFPGFVPAILNVISTDKGEARTKACSILWSFAAEIKNQVPVVERGDILPVLVRVAQEDVTTEARFKCVAALTLLAESLENAVPLLQAGALVPLMDILQQAGADPTQWKGQTASWCVGFLMNISQSDEAVPSLRQAGVVELLAPLLTLDHYQSLKAAMAVTFCCRFDKGDECYDLLRKTETVIPKIINLLHNTLAGRGGNGYKYGVFTLRSSVGCIAALACGPDFMKERIATALVFESLLRVVSDFCVDGGTAGAIVGGGREDVTSAKLAVQALQALTANLIPAAGSASLPFGQAMEERLVTAFEFYIQCPDVDESSRQLAADAKYRMEAARAAAGVNKSSYIGEDHDVASMASNCCGALDYFPGLSVGGDEDEDDGMLQGLYIPSLNGKGNTEPLASSSQQTSSQAPVVRTFLLADSVSGLRFVVPTDPSGGRFFNDTRLWCYRRGRYCLNDETPDPAYVWTAVLQRQYEAALLGTTTSTPEAETGDTPAAAAARIKHGPRV